MKKSINTVDLFCGAGGATTGLELALSNLGMTHKGIAINHWQVAVDTMRINHEDVDTKQMSIEAAVPADLVKSGVVDILWASPSCFTAGHLVTTSEGQKPIEEIRVGDVVLTHMGRWRKVIRTQSRGNGDTVIAVGAGHFGIECTANHKFWMRSSEMSCVNRKSVRTYEDPQWMRIDRAVANEALWSTPLKIEQLPRRELPKSLRSLKNPWWVIGRWIGDGWTSKGRHFDTTICCPHDDECVIEEALSGERKWYKCVKRTATNFTLTDKETRDWFDANFSKGAENKQLPSWCLTLTKVERQSIWDGYLSADGYTSEKARRHSCNTVSRKLVVSMRLLAEGLGIRCGMSTDNRTTYCIEGRSGTAKKQYRLHWQESHDKRRSLEAFSDGEKSWSRVRSVTPTGLRKAVYNIEVEEDHSYVLDGIVVKNCTHHSRACGGRPRQNQLRAQPELILTWLDQLYVKRIIVENVPEIVDWCALNKDGTPNKRLKGASFRAWVASIEARGYNVEWRIVNCADYGDATSRKRFFLKAVKRGCGRIRWPEATHSENPTEDLFGNTRKKWRGIRECIDFSDTGTSIFNRKKPLSENTMRRIEVGLKKYCGIDISPFIVRLRNGETVQSVDDPINTISAGGQHHMLCQPLVVSHKRNGKATTTDKPIGTCTTKDCYSVVQSLVMDHFKGGDAVPTDKPIGAQTTHARYSLVTPMVLGRNGGSKCNPVCETCPTIAEKGSIRLVMPFVFDNANGGVMVGSDKPINTLTGKDNHMAAFPVLSDGRLIDIRIRMLKPEELAAAHSFPADYKLTGTKTDQVKQIGNSVPVMTAAAMCQSDLEEGCRKEIAA